MHKRHFNHKYATIDSKVIPVGSNDRYNAQDLGRDMRYLEGLAGRVMLARLGLSTALLSGGVVTEGSTKALVNITAAVGLCEYNVTVTDDDEAWAVPPATETEQIVQTARSPGLADFSLEDATLDGSTPNYVKLRYLEEDVQTRTRTNASGTYAYSVEEGYEIICDAVAPTSRDVLLATLVGNGTSTLTITQEDPVTDEAMQQIRESLLATQNNEIENLIAMKKHDIGEPVFNIFKKTPSSTFPAIRIDDADHDLAVANWPELVPPLRAESMTVDGVSSFTGTVSGSSLTLAATTAGDLLIAGMIEDAKVQGGDAEMTSFANWRCINIAGIDYGVTAINAGTRVFSLTGTPPTGSQTVIFYPFRIPGSTTTARVFRTSARALMSQGDAEGTILPGLRRRDYFQSHWHSVRSNTNTGVFTTGTGANTAVAGAIGNFFDTVTARGAITDGVNGTPRSGARTEPRSLGAHLYLWGGRYLA